VGSLVSDAVGVGAVLRTVAAGASPVLAGAGIVGAQKLAEVAHPGGIGGAAGDLAGDVVDLSVGIAARAAPLAASLAASATVFAGSLYVSQALFAQARLSCAIPGVAPVLGASAVAVGSALAGQAAQCLTSLRRDGLGTPAMDLATPGGRRRMFASVREHAAGIQPDALLLDAVVGMALFRILGGRFATVLPSDVRFPGGAAFKAGSIPASGRNYAGDGARAEIHSLGRRFGCHSCGNRMSRRYNADHQPPNKYAKLREQRSWATLWMKPKPVVQRFYPQCHSCSNLQGGAVHSDTAMLVMHRQLPLQPWHWVPGAAVAALAAPPALAAMISDEDRQARLESRIKETAWGAGGEALRRRARIAEAAAAHSPSTSSPHATDGGGGAAASRRRAWGLLPQGAGASALPPGMPSPALADDEAAWALLGGRAGGAFLAAESLAASMMGLPAGRPSAADELSPRRKRWGIFGRSGTGAAKEATGRRQATAVDEKGAALARADGDRARRSGRPAWQATRSFSRHPTRHGNVV